MLGTAFAAADISGRVITIERVELQKEPDGWVTVIEPDRRVDLLKEEPTVVFFNNTGRVPAGRYQNFKIGYIENNTSILRTLTAKEGFGKSFEVKKGSFIRVSFMLDLSAGARLEKAMVTVDKDAREFSEGELKWL